MARKALTLDSDTVALLKRLWRERVAQHKRSLGFIMILIVIGGAATSLYPLLIREAFDALDMRNMDILYWGPLVVIVVTSIKGFALYGQVVLTNVVVCRVEADMQSALYAHLIDLDLAQLQKDSPATLTQRFTNEGTDHVLFALDLCSGHDQNIFGFFWYSYCSILEKRNTME